MTAQIEKSEPKRLDQHFFERPVDIVAPDLIGCHLFTTIKGHRVGGMIIETEAYDQNDAFSHCYTSSGGNPPATSSKPMFFEGGHVYIYRTRFGFCLNLTCGEEDFGSAVLIRSLLPTKNLACMRERRYQSAEIRDDSKFALWLCRGPQRLCEALGLDKAIYTQSLNRLLVVSGPFEFERSRESPSLLVGPRIGLDAQIKRMPKTDPTRLSKIENHKVRLWRWGHKDHQAYLSEKFIGPS